LALAPPSQSFVHLPVERKDAESQQPVIFGIGIHFGVEITEPSQPVFKNLLVCKLLGVGRIMKLGLAERARSRMAQAQAETAHHPAIAHSEALILRQRELISRLHAQGRPTSADERVLAQIEKNMLLMHKVQRFIKTGQPRASDAK
jgi:hypothetical protein